MLSSEIAGAPGAVPIGKASRKRVAVASERTRRIKLDRSDYVLRGISYTTITIFVLFCRSS